MKQKDSHNLAHLSRLYNSERFIEPPFIDLFCKLREADILLTVDDYKLLIISIESGFELSGKQEFKSLCSTLWIKSREEERVFDELFSQYMDQTWNALSRQYSLVQGREEKRLLHRVAKIWQKKKKNLLAISFFFLIGASGSLFIEKNFSFQTNHGDPSLPSSLVTEDKQEQDYSLSRWKVMPVVAIVATATLFMAHLIIEGVLSYDDDGSFEDSEPKSSKASEQMEGEIKTVIKQEETLSIDFGSSESDRGQSLPLSLLKSLQKEALTVPNKRYRALYTISYNERLSLRQMKQAWQYLRQPIKQGVGTELDIEMTVEKAAKQGMFLSPIFKPSQIDRAEVILMVDWGGSMLPFHSIADDLIKTASSSGRFNRIKVFYFNNFPKKKVFLNRFFIECTPLVTYLNKMNYARSSIIVVSDAGAARGNNSEQRFEGTKKFIATARQNVRCISWLNPMPCSRWLNTSAERISLELVPMFETTYAGMRDAVRAAEGEWKPHMYSYFMKTRT